MPAEGGGATAFDRRDDLKLSEAQVAALLRAPRESLGAEDVRDLEGRVVHGRPRLQRGGGLKRRDDLTQDIGGDLGVEGSGLELGVSEQHLDDADVFLLLQQVGGK